MSPRQRARKPLRQLLWLCLQGAQQNLSNGAREGSGADVPGAADEAQPSLLRCWRPKG